MTEKLNFSEQIHKLYPVKTFDFRTDRSDLMMPWDNNPFQHLMDEFKKKYDEFLSDCFLKCGFDEDYIFAHADEFSIRIPGYGSRIEAQYFWKGDLIFSVLSAQEPLIPSDDFASISNIIKYTAAFTGVRKDEDEIQN